MTNERKDKDVAEVLKAGRTVPGPAAREKAVSAMSVAVTRHRSPFSWRRAVGAAAFVVALVTSGVWLLPERQSIALADVARAMASVQSAHLVGWRVDGSTGEQRAFEVWVKGPSKLRWWVEGGQDVADDGERLVLVSSPSSAGWPTIAEICPSGELQGIGEGMTYLDLFQGPLMVQRALEGGGTRVREWTPVTLADGREGVELVLSVPGCPENGVQLMTVDVDTELLVQWEFYNSEGDIWEKVERIDYDMALPDSIFAVEIPEDALVIDQLAPTSPELRAEREAMAEQLYSDPGAHQACQFGGPGGTGGSGYHTDLRFTCLDRDGIIVYYLSEDNTYYVIGTALVHMADGSDFWQVVEDAEFVPATAPDTSPEMEIAELEGRLSPEVKAEREARGKEFRAVGGVLIADNIRGRCATKYHPGMWFKCLSDDSITVYYLPDRNVYHVMGKALVWTADFEEVFEDAEVPAPGEPEGLP
jgi:outer membrane lipoprotein-sorting protein